MFSTIEPEGWSVVFGVFVTDQDGTPIQGLTKKSFSCWQLTTVGEVKISMIVELFAVFATSKMPGIYRLQTDTVLGIQAPSPQEFVYALRVAHTRRKVALEGFTTVDVTYLGKPK